MNECFAPLQRGQVTYMWGFTPAIFGPLEECFRFFLEQNGSDLQAESYLPVAMGELLVEGRARVEVLRCADPWFGITYRDDHIHSVAHASTLRERTLPEKALVLTPLASRDQLSGCFAAELRRALKGASRLLKPSLGSGDAGSFDAVGGTQLADRFGKVVPDGSFGQMQFLGNI
jgi:hypothetical protein